MKQSFKRSYVTLVCIGISISSILSYDGDDTISDTDMPEISASQGPIDDFDSFFDTSGEMQVERSALKSCEPGEAATWVQYLTALDIPTLLNQPFYHATSIANSRNIINYPNFFLFQPLADQQLIIYPFVNSATRQNFTKTKTVKCKNRKDCYYNGQRLGSYLNIENSDVLSFLETDLPKFAALLPPSLAPLKAIHFPLILKTVGNAHLENRRLGFLLHYYKEFDAKTMLEVRLPIMYQLNNLNFTIEEKEYLDLQLSEFNNDPNFDEVQFGKQHVVFDALGSGTLDLTVSRNVYETDTAKVNLGFALYLPTDKRWVTGMYGTYFLPRDIQPKLALCDLVDITTNTLNPNATTILQDYFTAMLDHFSSAVLQCNLGYNQHLALALKVVPYWQWSENVVYSGMYIFEYLLPKDEERFYIYAQTKPFNERFNALTDPQEQLNLFEQQLTEHLFPRVFTTHVAPGFIINTISNLQWTRYSWHYTIGYNWWYKTEEKLSNIQAQPEIYERLDIQKATQLSSQQVKIYGKLHRMFETSNHTLSFALFGNVTIYNDNMSNDFLVGFSFDKTF